MTQLHLDRLHTATALTQEATQLREHRLEHEAEPCRVVDLRLEVASRRESLVRREGRARLRPSAGRAVEHREQVCPEAAREPVPRQAQAFPDRAHAHGGEGLQHLLRPARAGEWQRRDAAREILLAAHEHRAPSCVQASEPRRCERRRRDREPHRGARGLADFLLEPVTQLSRAAEQTQAAAHLEQHAVRRLEAYARREVQAATRHGFEQLPFSSRIACQGVQCRHQRTRRVHRHARVHAGCTHVLAAGSHYLAIALEVDDRDGRVGRQCSNLLAQRIEHQRGQVHCQPEFARTRLRSRREPDNGE